MQHVCTALLREAAALGAGSEEERSAVLASASLAAQQARLCRPSAQFYPEGVPLASMGTMCQRRYGNDDWATLDEQPCGCLGAGCTEANDDENLYVRLMSTDANDSWRLRLPQPAHQA